MEEVSPSGYQSGAHDGAERYAREETNYIYDIEQNQRNVYAADSTFEVDDPMLHAYSTPNWGLYNQRRSCLFCFLTVYLESHLSSV